MALMDQPNREAVGLEPIAAGSNEEPAPKKAAPKKEPDKAKEGKDDA